MFAGCWPSLGLPAPPSVPGGALLSVPVAAAAAEADPWARRLAACFACHGPQGRATPQGYFPRIAGKTEGYLFNQLQNFREGRRHNAAMTHLVQHMDDAYLRDIARYFAQLQVPYPDPVRAGSPAEQALGERWARLGDASRGVPACAHCHGAALMGAQPSVPGLLGLPRDYLMAQLGAWRTGQRRAASPDCMAHIGERLSLTDLSAVASWLSAQPVPTDARPVAAVLGPMALSCGSGTR